MNLEEIRDKLKLYNIAELAKELEIPYHVLNTIANGRVKNPKHDVYIKIVNFLESK